MPGKNVAIKHASRLHLHTGAGEALCRVYLQERRELCPGETCLAQLIPEAPLAVIVGDYFVVRFYSPVQTVGGGVVLGTSVHRYSARDTARWRLLALRQSGAPKAALAAAAQEPLTASTNDATGGGELGANGSKLPRQAPPNSNKAQDERWQHQLLELLKSRHFLPLNEEEAARETGLALRNCARILGLLIQEGAAQRLDKIGWLAIEYWSVAVAALTTALEHEPFSLAQYRDLLGASRKPCQILLEYFDSTGLTLRQGDARVRGPRWESFSYGGR